ILRDVRSVVYIPSTVATLLSPLSLHDALPISAGALSAGQGRFPTDSTDGADGRGSSAPSRLTGPGPSLGRPAPDRRPRTGRPPRSEEHTSELQSRENLVCRLLLEKKEGKAIIT